MTEQLTLRQQITEFKNGKYNSPDLTTQINAGWWDWFCRDTSLVNKTKKLYKKIIQISNSNLIDLDNTYVFFKNNCPMEGNLYDDFRICDLETKDVIFTVTSHNGHKNTNDTAEVWGRDNNFKEALVSGKWIDVKKSFRGELNESISS